MGKHGFARRSTFAVVQADEGAAVFRLQASAETRASYPFDFQLDIRFALEGAALTVTATVSNLGDGAMPATMEADAAPGNEPSVLRKALPVSRPRQPARPTRAPARA